jgi:excisionase family DNA binding protein
MPDKLIKPRKHEIPTAGEITIAEAAERVGVSPRQIQMLIANGTLPVRVANKKKRFIREADLDTAFAQRKQRGRPVRFSYLQL